MKKELFILIVGMFCFALLPNRGSLLHSITWIINQDGTGDFTVIQEGIDTSIDGDTVLVYPGRYYENIDFNGKNITLASLELTTGNESYVDSTIIDGNHESSCIVIGNGETDAIVCGFSLTNGVGLEIYDDRWGGGILIYNYSNVVLINCKIYNNSASTSGGGIYASTANLILEGVDIFNNYSNNGGGIGIQFEVDIIFDEVNRCNIYNNYAGVGCDILASSSYDINVVLDTFTVITPDNYFATYPVHCFPGDGEFIFDIQNGWMETVNHDLYVSPDGDDDNSGLTYDEPLKTISWALHKIASDSLNPKTVFLAPGIYSGELNGQIYPLGFKSNISMKGDIDDHAIIYKNSPNYGLVRIAFEKKNVLIENVIFQSPDYSKYSILSVRDSNHESITTNNITLKNIIIEDCLCLERYVASFYLVSDLLLENVIIRNNTSEANAGISFINGNAKFINCTLDNNHSTGEEEVIGCFSNFYCIARDSVLIENCVFSNSSTQNIEYRTFSIGTQQFYEPEVDVISSLFYNNYSPVEPPMFLGDFSYIPCDIINCTFVDNTSPLATLQMTGYKNLYNTIMYDNTPYEIFLEDLTIHQGYYSTLNVSHCNIKNGETGIYNENYANVVNWMDGNMDEDSIFVGEGDYPFALLDSSLCIDAGTLELPEGVELPELDLAGNQRIYGESVDMGAYEWYATGAEENQIPPEVSGFQLSNFPNPFNPYTIIKYFLLIESKVKLSIYNIKGQLIRTLVNEIQAYGEHTTYWEGRDENLRFVSSGIYFYKISAGEETEMKKMILLK